MTNAALVGQRTLRPRGITLTYRREYAEYRVNFSKGREETAYYSNDLADAIATGEYMANHKGGAALASNG